MTANRLNTLREKMQEKKLDAFFISSIPSLTYLTGFSGFETEDRNAFLLITQTHQYIFTNSLYKEAVKKYINNFTLISIDGDHPLSTSLQTLIEKHVIHRLGFESKDLKAIEYISLAKKLGKKTFIPADNITDSIRIVKSATETQAIKKACALGDIAFTYLLTQIKEGITEKELAVKYEIFVKEHGADISFTTIVAFGEHGAHPHHVPTDTKLQKNSFIVLDFGVKLDDYCSDMTRTVFFGKASDAQKQMYETVKVAQQKAIDYIKNNYSSSDPELVEGESRSNSSRQSSNNIVTGEAVDKVARDYIISQGFPDMPHSLGHGIGLLVHEKPTLSPYAREKLTEGMVFSVEPGIYLPGIGGVRIEDLITVEHEHITVLTNAPKDLIELS